MQSTVVAGSRTAGGVAATPLATPATSAALPARVWTLLAIAVAGVALFWNLGRAPLMQPDEGRNAEVAREMKASGDFLVPTLDGLPYLDKPALFFGLGAVSMTAFGETEAAARLPSALSAALLLALLYGFGRSVHGRRAATLAVVVAATMPLFVAFARTVIFDMPLALFTSLAIVSGFLAERPGAPRTGWRYAGAAAAGIATLLKGPVGFLVPGLVLSAFALVERRPTAIRRLFRPGPLLLFFALVLPWFVALSLRHPDFPRYGLLHESLGRFATTEFHRTQPIYFFGYVLLAACLPWSLIFPEAVVAGWRARARWRPADRLCVVWIVVAVLFFSASRSKLPGYVLSTVFPLSLLTARIADAALAPASNGRARRLLAHASAALAVVTGLAAVALAAVFLSPSITARLAREGNALFDAVAPVWPPFAAGFAVIAVTSALAAFRREPRLVLAAMACVPLLLLVAGGGVYERIAAGRSAKALAVAVAAQDGGLDVACLHCFPTALPFYLGRTIAVVSNEGDEITSNYVSFRLEGGEPWPDALIQTDRLPAWLDGRRRPVLLLAKERGRADLDAIALARGAQVEAISPGWFAARIAPPGGP